MSDWEQLRKQHYRTGERLYFECKRLYYYCFKGWQQNAPSQSQISRKKQVESEKSFNRLDQYNRRNNLEIQGIPSTVGDEVLDDKVIEIFECLNIPLAKSDIEDCHRLGKSNPKNTIVRFVNRKNCYAALSKKLDL